MRARFCAVLPKVEDSFEKSSNRLREVSENLREDWENQDAGQQVSKDERKRRADELRKKRSDGEGAKRLREVEFSFAKEFLDGVLADGVKRVSRS